MIAVELQVLGSALRAIAEEMGAVLVRSAFSANIKERRDCSTALFDEAGRMVTQAEHIPVHLGAMPEAVAAVRAHDPPLGEPWILNDPYAGGTHLPDLTIVTKTELGYAVTRAHHADVGGAEPGSLPARSTSLSDEGVVIPPTRLDEPGPRAARRPDAQPGRAARGSAGAASGSPARGGASSTSASVAAATASAQAMDELLAYSERVVRSAVRRPPGRTVRGRGQSRDA